MRLIIKNGAVLDTATMTYGNQTVVCENGEIVALGDDTADGDVVIDARGHRARNLQLNKSQHGAKQILIDVWPRNLK